MPPHKLEGRSIIDKVRIDVDRRVDNVTTQSLTSAYYCRSGLLLQAGEKLILTVRYNSFLFFLAVDTQVTSHKDRYSHAMTCVLLQNVAVKWYFIENRETLYMLAVNAQEAV